jgi:hypothetical protein
MNYMDYTDDRGHVYVYWRTKARMDAIFVSGGARAALESKLSLIKNTKPATC